MSNSSATPWTVAYQAPLSMGFSRQEYWSGLPFSSPGDLPDPRIEPISPGLVGGFFTTEPSGKSQRDREKSQIQKASKALVYLVNHQVDSLDLFLSWASLVAQMVKKKKKKKNRVQCGSPRINPWVGKIPWRREWQPTPVFLPGEFHRQRSLAGYSPWGRKELDRTEYLTLSLVLVFVLSTPSS